MRAVAAVLLLAAAATPGASLGRLADAVATEIVRIAAGRPVDLAPPEDRTGSGLGSDLDHLVRARLEGRVAAATSGERLAVHAVLAQAGTRLVWSARVVEEPAGTPFDVISVSTTWDPALLPLIPERRGRSEGVDVLERTLTPPVEGRVVALAFAGDERLLVLFDDALALYRRDGLALRLEARRDLPGPLAPVRFPGGVLLAMPGESACWAMTSRAARASLFSLAGGRLTAVQQADAIPWPRAPAGVRFRPGTNLIEVALPGVEGPLLAIEAHEGWVVQQDGLLARAGASEPPAAGRRAGPAITTVWPGLLAAAAPDPPGEHDRIVLLRDSRLDVAGAVAVDGAVRALAAHRHGATTLLAAAIEEPRADSASACSSWESGSDADPCSPGGHVGGGHGAGAGARHHTAGANGPGSAVRRRDPRCADGPSRRRRALRPPRHRGAGPGRPRPRDAARHRRRRAAAARPRALLGERRRRPRMDAAPRDSDVPRRLARRRVRRRARAPPLPAQRIHGGGPPRADARGRQCLSARVGPMRSPGVAAPDETRVVLRFREPSALPLAALASPAAAVVSARGAGAGPFSPTTPPSARGVSATAFGRHVRGRPFLDVVRLVGAASDRARPDAAAADLTAGAPPLPPATGLLLLVLEPGAPLTEGQARALIASSVDRAALARHFLPGGEPADTLLPPALLPPLPGPRPPGRVGPVPLSGRLTLRVGPEVPLSASRRVVAHLAALGLEVQALPASATPSPSAPAQAHLLAWYPEVAEAGLALEELAALAGSPPYVRAALEYADTVRDEDRRRAELQRAEELLRSRHVLVPLARLPLGLGPRPGVHGVRASASGVLRLEDAWVEP